MSLLTAWGRDTSADPANWSEDNPSYGQCAVTALVLQDVAGGRLMRTTVGGVSHYLNELPGGLLVDLTVQQFGPGATYDTQPEPRTRDYVLSHYETRRRYERLAARVAPHWTGTL